MDTQLLIVLSSFFVGGVVGLIVGARYFHTGLARPLTWLQHDHFYLVVLCEGMDLILWELSEFLPEDTMNPSLAGYGKFYARGPIEVTETIEKDDVIVQKEGAVILYRRSRMGNGYHKIRSIDLYA